VKKYLAVLFIIAGVFASYAPALRDGFVWDDTALILRDPLIRSWRLIPEAFNHFLFVDATASDFYRPLQRLTYTLDYVAFAFRPGPYHAASILWHAAAAIEAGFTRLRPVLMTAGAMILGMIPMALGVGEGGEQNAPLARAVIGGLLFGTAATMIFVPVVYRILRRDTELWLRQELK